MLTRLLCLGIASLAIAGPALGQSAADDRFDRAQQRYDREYRLFQEEIDRYQATRGRGDGGEYRRAPDAYDYEDGGEGAYDPASDYRAGPNYRERVVSPDERVYAGYDGRYYCRRSDGTTGLIVGGAAGGILGNVIDGGRSRVLGTLLGGAAGALAGRAVDQNQSQVRCR